MRILVFGDSIGEGFYDFEKGGWVDRLKADFWQEWQDGNHFGVTNFSISGYEILDTIKRFNLEMKIFGKENIKIIFAIGINDSITSICGNKNIYTKKEFEENLEKLILLAKNYSKDILFLGLTKVDEKFVNPFPWSKNGECYKNKRIKMFDEIIKNSCKKNSVKYLSLFNLLTENDLEDGIHPNSIGHNKIYKFVKDYLVNIKLD